MKSNANVTLDSEILAEAKKQGLNVSGICNDALTEAVGANALTPEDKAAQGMAKLAEDKERVRREGEIDLIHKQLQEKNAIFKEIVQLKGEAVIKVYRESASKFPRASAFNKDLESMKSQLARLSYAIPLMEKVSPKPPSKKKKAK